MTAATFIATCPDETKDLLVDELTSFGVTDAKAGYKAVRFTADEELIYRIHLKSRIASRFLRVIKEAACPSDVILKQQASRIKWDTFMTSKDTFIVEGVAGDRGPDAMNSNTISKSVRAGLEDYFQHKKLQVPKVDLKEPSVVYVAFVYAKKVTISIDYSGKSLHKRGFRIEGHPAPLKETLASSLLYLAGYDGSQVLYDPMCGGGTIPIEACYMALHKAPLIHRKKGDFGFEHLKTFDSKLWKTVQDEVRLERLEEPPQAIYASDISPHYINLARDNALRARVEKHIDFKTGSFFELDPPAESGILIMNLPYGERLNVKEDLTAFYKQIGDTLKKKYQGWNAWLFAAEEAPYKFIGLKPKRKISLLNGSIPCKFLMFELYAGTKKHKKE